MKSFLAFVILVFCLNASFAQNHNYNIYNLSSDNGLPTNDFDFAFQDSYGFLWLASYDGLFRWDGYSFKKYHHDEENPRSLSHNIVYAVYEDAQRRLWVGTIDGLDLYDRTSDGFIRCSIGQQPGQKVPVNAIVADSKNQLWIGTSYGLCVYNHDTSTSDWFINNVSADVIFSMTIDREDNLWLGTYSDGVHKFSTKDKRFIRVNSGSSPNLVSEKIKSLHIDKKGRLWVGTADAGISILDSSGKVIRHYKDFTDGKSVIQSPVNCMFEDSNQTMWIGIDREPLYYIGKDGIPHPITETLSDNTQSRLRSVRSIFEDSFGNIWFATMGSGLFYTNEGKNVFQNYLRTPGRVSGLESTTITCFYEDAAGNVWLGTDGSGMLRFNPHSKTFKLFTSRSHNLSSDAITDIKGDKNGKLWISSWYGGLTRFDPITEKVKSYLNDRNNPRSIAHNDSKSILIDDSIIWIGTHGRGLVAFDPRTERFTDQSNNTFFPFQLNAPAWINHLYKDSRARLWVSTYSGVHMYDGKELRHFTHTNDTSSISNNSVNMVTEDTEGLVWIVSESGGLDRFNDKEMNFTRFNDQLSFPETMKGIIADLNNTLWITSNEGIIAFDKARKNVRRYDASEGLQGNTFFHKAVLRTKDGQLFFGGPRGFNVFHPDSLTSQPSKTRFYFTDLYVYNTKQKAGVEGSPLEKVLELTKSITLTHEQSFFSIEFAAINFYSIGNTRYAYKVDGLQDQWIDLQGERKVSFTNLDPGNYTLRIRYTDASGAWSPDQAEIRITILPPWWKTIWFRTLLVVVLFAAIVALFYLRLRSINIRNRNLEQEVQRRTLELSELNSFLMERNEEIMSQNERLEHYNEEMIRQTDKILEQQIHISRQNEKLEDHVEELQKLNRTKDHFFSIIAHDLKNPVSALTGISEFVKDNISKLDKKDAQEYINSISKSAYSIYDLLVNLLNWSQTQSKSITCSPAHVNVKEVVQKNVILLDQQFRNKHITLNLNIAEEHVIFADYNMFDTVVRNLLSNSVKFTEYNGSVTVSSVIHDAEIVISVSDTGVGMSDDQLQRLFKLDKDNISVGTAGERGTGLGLVICRDFIEANKGKINVTSKPGAGTTFYISLPKSVPAVKQRTDSAPVVAGENSALGFWEAFPMEKLIKIKGKKILIVDDNREIRSYLRLLLSETFEIFEAENGKEGLSIALEAQPTTIISDVIMPGMNGIELCKEIKSTTATSHIPVILLTSISEERGHLNGYEAGADAYLTKPVRKEILIQVILNLIQNQEKVRDRMREGILGSTSAIPQDLVVNKRDEEFMNKLIEFINQNISNPNFDARQISDEFGISRSVLYTKIKTLTGQSVHEFVKSIRLKQSLKLLLEGRYTISQIAFEVGFNSHSYFDKCFAKQFGMGPKEYIAKRKNLTTA